jgi:hypothetical protein
MTAQQAFRPTLAMAINSNPGRLLTVVRGKAVPQIFGLCKTTALTHLLLERTQTLLRVRAQIRKTKTLVPAINHTHCRQSYSLLNLNNTTNRMPHVKLNRNKEVENPRLSQMT